jgi:FkbM family methyltransferase
MTHLRKIINETILRRWGMHIERSPTLTRGALLTDYYELILDYEVRLKREAFFCLQIGANDGVSRGDDLIGYVRDYGIRGVMVEPQPAIFETLRANYREFPTITVVNKALHETDRQVVLYMLDAAALRASGARLPRWARTSGIASFSRAHVERHVRRLGVGTEAIIVEARVPCVTLDELIAEHRITTVDLLKIDTEGYDYNILRMLDLARVQPRLIRFEHAHMRRRDYDEVIERLSRHQYQFICGKTNTAAVRVHRSS